jgi:asparagine synthase (glutamine-hydrolysing)
MSHGVEVRYPFLDPEFVDFCCRLPGRLKLRGLRDKMVLRVLASRHLPREIWDRPKQPYRAPTTVALFDGASGDYVDELLSAKCLERFGLVEAGAAGRLVEKARAKKGRMSGEREEMALVGIITLQLLGHQYLECFADRAAQCRAALAEIRPSVLEDRVGHSLSPERGRGWTDGFPHRQGVDGTCRTGVEDESRN